MSSDTIDNKPPRPPGWVAEGVGRQDAETSQSVRFKSLDGASLSEEASLNRRASEGQSHNYGDTRNIGDPHPNHGKTL